MTENTPTPQDEDIDCDEAPVFHAQNVAEPVLEAELSEFEDEFDEDGALDAEPTHDQPERVDGDEPPLPEHQSTPELVLEAELSEFESELD